MNQKRKYKHDGPAPVFLHEIRVPIGARSWPLAKGQLVSVIRRPGLIAGKYEFLYATEDSAGLAICVEGPVSRERRHRVIRVSDIKQVHIRSGKR